MSDSLIQVPFHGDTIETVAKNDTWMASLRRMCENLGVDYKTQARKLKEKKWAVVVIMPTTGSDGKTYEMAMIDRRTMTMWLAGINPSKVKPELREKIEAYQCEAADALDKYFNEGAAIRFKTNSMDEESLILAKANQIQSRLLGEARRENLELRASNEKMRPLALLGEAFVSADGTMSVRQAARHFQAIDKRMNCDTVYEILRGAGYIELRSKAPTVKAVKPGYLKPVMSRKANGKLDRQYARFTAKGVNWFIDRFIYGRSQGRLPGWRDERRNKTEDAAPDDAGCHGSRTVQGSEARASQGTPLRPERESAVALRQDSGNADLRRGSHPVRLLAERRSETHGLSQQPQRRDSEITLSSMPGHVPVPLRGGCVMAGSQIESSLDGWPISKVASFLGVSKGSLYVWSCHDKWGGRYPPAPKRIGRRLVWDPREVIDYRNNRCAITRKELVYGE